MRGTRSLTGCAVMAAVAAVSPAVGVAAAQATDTDCARGHSCLWEDRHYDGSRWFDQTSHGFWNTGWWHNDDASSAWNRQADESLLLYNATDHSPEHGVACVPRKYGTGNLNTYGWEDRVSSVGITDGYCSNLSETIIGGPKSNY